MCGEFTVKREELESTPFTDKLYNRVIPQALFYDPNYDEEKLPDHMEGEDWFLLMPDSTGDLQWVIAESSESGYFGSESANEETDLQVPFLNLYYQHLSWPDILGILPDLVEDVRNMSASLSKIGLYQSLSMSNAASVERFVVTELEYLFTVCRSMYDLLQFIIKNTWDRIRIDNGREKSTLKSAFSDMVLHASEPQSAESLVDKYGLTNELAQFYEDSADRFLRIREFRDEIAHNGETVDTIFVKEKGFAVDVTSIPYCRFDVWSGEIVDDNNLAPIWPFISTVVGETVETLNLFIAALLRDPVRVPPEIAPGYKHYIRGNHIQNLKCLDSLTETDIWGEQFVEQVTTNIGVEKMRSQSN